MRVNDINNLIKMEVYFCLIKMPTKWLMTCLVTYASRYTGSIHLDICPAMFQCHSPKWQQHIPDKQTKEIVRGQEWRAYTLLSPEECSWKLPWDTSTCMLLDMTGCKLEAECPRWMVTNLRLYHHENNH